MTQPPLLAVGAASGGLGASTLALALGRSLARTGPPSVVADLDLTRGGLEVTAGIEHLPGRRWDDLREVRGRVPAARLLSTLPGEAGCHVLSGMGGARSEIPAGVVLEVVDSLHGGGVPLVLDLPVSSPLLADVVARSPVVVLLVALRTRGLADAEACVERVLAAAPEACDPTVLLVTRGGRATADVLDDLVAHLGVPHVHHLRDDPAVVRDAERGGFPGVARDTVRHGARAVVESLAALPVAS